MTKEQYDKVVPYKSVCDLFANTGSYSGGAAGLFDLYKDMFNMGNPVKVGCPACAGAVLLDIHSKIMKYEGYM